MNHWMSQIAEKLRPRLYFWVAVFVLVPRLMFLAVMPERSISGNVIAIMAIGENLAAGKGFLNDHGGPDAYFNPGYPFFLAGCRLIAGTHYLLAAKIGQILFDIMTAIFLCVLVRPFFSTAGIAIFAAAFALHPLFIHYTNNINQEPMLIVMVALSFVALLRAVRRPSWPNFALAGLLAAVATLTKTTVVLLPLAVGLVYWLKQRTMDRRSLLHAAVYLCTYAVVLLPWCYRNHVTFGRFSPGVGGFGNGFWWGSDPRIFASYGKAQREAAARAAKEMEAKGIFPPAVSTVFENEQYRWRMGLQNYKDMLHRPAYMAQVFLMKGTRSLYASEDRPSGHVPMILMQVPVIVLAILGWNRLRKRPATNCLALFIAVYIGYFYVIVSASVPMIRYFAPAMPLLLMTATAGLSQRLTMDSVDSSAQMLHPESAARRS